MLLDAVFVVVEVVVEVVVDAVEAVVCVPEAFVVFEAADGVQEVASQRVSW